MYIEKYFANDFKAYSHHLVLLCCVCCVLLCFVCFILPFVGFICVHVCKFFDLVKRGLDLVGKV